MGIFDVGRVCVKIAGRDARKRCVVVEVIDSRYVMIDGETRRKKCNTSHLEPLETKVDLKSGADNSAVVKALKEEGIVCDLKKESQKQPSPKPKKVKKVKPKKEKSKAEKKEKPKVEKKVEKKESPKKAEVKPKKEEKKEEKAPAKKESKK